MRLAAAAAADAADAVAAQRRSSSSSICRRAVQLGGHLRHLLRSFHCSDA